MMNGRRSLVGMAIAGLAGAVLMAGCQTLDRPGDQPSAITDPCAERLHDLCGLLLLHQAAHGKLPEKLADLDGTAGPDQRQLLECPVSRKPYLYDRNGIEIPQQPGRIIIRDPLPSHSGFRWAITLMTPNSSQPLNTRVIAILEK